MCFNTVSFVQFLYHHYIINKYLNLAFIFTFSVFILV